MAMTTITMWIIKTMTAMMPIMAFTINAITMMPLRLSIMLSSFPFLMLIISFFFSFFFILYIKTLQQTLKWIFILFVSLLLYLYFNSGTFFLFLNLLFSILIQSASSISLFLFSVFLLFLSPFLSLFPHSLLLFSPSLFLLIFKFHPLLSLYSSKLRLFLVSSCLLKILLFSLIFSFLYLRRLALFLRVYFLHLLFVALLVFDIFNLLSNGLFLIGLSLKPLLPPFVAMSSFSITSITFSTSLTSTFSSKLTFSSNVFILFFVILIIWLYSSMPTSPIVSISIWFLISPLVAQILVCFLPLKTTLFLTIHIFPLCCDIISFINQINNSNSF